MSLLNKFLGLDRWQSLGQAVSVQCTRRIEPEIGSFAVFAAILVGLTPVALTFLDQLTPESSTTLPTVAFGVCAVLAVLIRWRLSLPFSIPTNWKQTFSLTHTAVALGCVPAVLLIVFSPELLADRHDLLTETVRPAGPPGAPRPSLLYVLSLLVFMAAWVAVTEELIFRGLLVSVLRRWRVFPKQWQRDLSATVFSALIFGLAHYATWGPVAAIALVGLGLGFVLAYIANGEQLIPIVLYHFVFDLLSISVSLFV